MKAAKGAMVMVSRKELAALRRSQRVMLNCLGVIQNTAAFGISVPNARPRRRPRNLR